MPMEKSPKTPSTSPPSTAGSKKSSSAPTKNVARPPKSLAASREGEGAREKQISSSLSSEPTKVKHQGKVPVSVSSPPSDKSQLLENVAGIIVKEHLQKRKREIVDKYMAVVNTWFERTFAPFETNQDEGGLGSSGGGRRDSRPAGRRRRALTGRAATASPKRTRGQKRRHISDDDGGGDDDDGDDDDDDGQANEAKGGEDDLDHNPSRNTKRTKTRNGPLELVCPYYQRDPRRFANSSTCRGHSWPSIPRLKEHLQRSHQRPQFQCKRCLELFAETGHLEKHQREEVPCRLAKEQSANPDPLDGYNAEQSDQIKKRFVGKSTEEKWKEIYCILFFVDREKEKIPSPYFSLVEHSVDRPFDTRKECVQLIRDKFIPALQRQLEALVDREISGSIGKKISSAIPSIINKEFNGIVRTWMEITPPSGLATSSWPDTGSEEPKLSTSTSDFLESLGCDELMAMCGMGSSWPLEMPANHVDVPLFHVPHSTVSDSDASDPFSASLQSSSNTSIDAGASRASPGHGNDSTESWLWGGHDGLPL